MEEIHEHHHDEHAHEGSGLATILITLLVLLLIGFLLWNFLPLRGERNTLDVNVNAPGINDGVQTQ